MRSNGANSGTALDYIFKVPRKLAFSKFYRYYFDFVLRLLYRVILFENIPETIEETFLKLILYTTGKISFFEGTKIDEPDQIIVPKGRRANIVFSDGTKMYINAETRVIFPTVFAKDKREILVDGAVWKLVRFIT